MTPAWVNSLEEYLRWVEAQLDRSGGELLEDYLDFEFVPSFEDPELTVALLLRSHNLVFAPHGTHLRFDLAVTDQLEPEKYSFHFQKADASLIWRLDKHRGHEDIVGGLSHVHERRDGGEQIAPCPEVEIDEVIDLVLDFNARL